MTFEQIKTPQELMQFLDENITYGVIDNNGHKFFDSNSEDFQQVCLTAWRTKPVEQILKDGVGHCYDQVEIERVWFEKIGYTFKTFWISAYQDGIENSGFSHTYLVYQENNSWYLFEHSDFFNRGIHKFNSLTQAVKWQAEKQIKFAESIVNPVSKYTVCIKEYSTPPKKLNMDEYINFIMTCKDFNLN